MQSKIRAYAVKSESKGEGTYNVVVIGAGTAGLVTAAGTAGLGGRVALIERHKMSGDCPNFGCVPSKALISSARLIRRIRRFKLRRLRARTGKPRRGRRKATTPAATPRGAD